MVIRWRFDLVFPGRNMFASTMSVHVKVLVCFDLHTRRSACFEFRKNKHKHGKIASMWTRTNAGKEPACHTMSMIVGAKKKQIEEHTCFKSERERYNQGTKRGSSSSFDLLRSWTGLWRFPKRRPTHSKMFYKLVGFGCIGYCMLQYIYVGRSWKKRVCVCQKKSH